MQPKTVKSFILALAAACAVAGGAFAGQAPLTTDSDLVINIKSLSAVATFYPVKINGKPVRVIAVVAPDKTVRTVFDACQSCGDAGYNQQRDALVCKSCGNQFSISSLEKQKGGCNPVPVGAANKTVTTDTITLERAFLERAANTFASWRGR